MALKKEVTMDDGQVAEYWKVAAVHLDAINKEVRCAASVFKDEQARQDGKSPATTKSFSVPFSSAPDAYNDLVAASGGIIHAMYEYLKTIPELSGATDV